MSVGKCDYQLLTPGVGRFEPAPVYPDLVVAARMATAARSARPRRFAFCQATPIGPGSDEVSVRAVYQGFQNPDGSCVLLLSGQPYGYYQSIDAAFHYATGSHLYLTWLEPDHALPDGQEPTAAVEARHNPASVWLVALPFIAHGPHDARLRALETAAHLEPTTPGLTRRSALLFNGEDPTQPVTLFCPIEPCMRPPFHHGQHHPETELPKPGPAKETETETRPPEPGPETETETETETKPPDTETRTETTHDPEASRNNAPGPTTGPGAGQSAVSPADGGEN